ncbi:MAG TPA: hypothetical protein DDY98_04925 [Ruminococcaceae bacterium]|nr:hypothetical protein [Oscillospiraceae bacterium]
MKKQLICVALVTAALSATLASCSIGGKKPEETQAAVTVQSYSERASFYDALVAGDSNPIDLVTTLNDSITIEGDSALVSEGVYEKIVNIANKVFVPMRSKYGSSGTQTVTIVLDPSGVNYSPCYAVGNTVLISAEWLNNHPKDCDILIEGLAMSVMNYSKKDEIPEWIINALKVYIRDEYACYKADSSLTLPKKYNGKSYEKDAESAAAFLKWVKESQNVDIADLLDSSLYGSEGYQPSFWMEKTGKTLDQLWSQYKSA